MDAKRANAYRHLLYVATLDIRNLCQSRAGVSWNPAKWRRSHLGAVKAGALADWLHNLASFAARDFVGFDESRFWSEHASVLRRVSGQPVDRYEAEFRQALDGEPGVWGGGQARHGMTR